MDAGRAVDRLPRAALLLAAEGARTLIVEVLEIITDLLYTQ